MADRIVTDFSQQPAQSTSIDSDSGPAKQAVSRGARACQICRAAKMKCVGAEDDGAKPCQRCRRSNNECIFEKHRRGRKPGSKLSEASKMLRKLEKGGGGVPLQKVKSHEPVDVPTQTPFPVSDSRSAPLPESSHYQQPYSPPPYVPSQRPRQQHHSQLPSQPSQHPFPTLTASYPAPRYPPPLSPLQANPQAQSVSSSPQSLRSHMEDDDDYDEREEETIYPAKMVEREGRRHSYFGTVLTTPTPVPGHKPSTHPNRDKTSPSHSPGHQLRSRPSTSGPSRLPALPAINDPITAGIVSEQELEVIFSSIFKRLNPFINLLDPALHTATYVRSRCPFLFTVLVMAGAKFFRQDIFRAVQRIAEEMCVRAFQEGWKRVEVVQAFMCMTYWKEPDDTRTWTFIGYAARMAVEIGLNTHCPEPPPGETNIQRLERRNRERTYLVLWVHDRSLSMQTGRQWMLPEDELVRNAEQWYHESTLLPIDVVVSAQVSLRRIAAAVTDMFYLSRAKRIAEDVNYDVLLTGTNQRLQQWNEHWMNTARTSEGTSFHTSLLTFFKLHVRLFLNSFGLHSSLVGSSNPTLSPSYETVRYGPSLPALSICYNSAVETLRLVATEFATVDMLRYGQDSITVMTAYSACFLLKLCRSPVAGPELGDGAKDTVYSLINATGDAYQECARGMSVGETLSATVEYHGRFLKTLVTKDKALRVAMAGRERRRGDPGREGSEHYHDQSNTSHRRRGNGTAEVDGRVLASPPDTTTNANVSYTRHRQNGTGTSSASNSASSPYAITSNDSPSANVNGIGNHQTHTAGNIYQPRPKHAQQPPSAQTPAQYWHFPASPHLPAHPLISPGGGMEVVPSSYTLDEVEIANGSGDQSAMGLDDVPNQKMEVAYWYTMHSELGYGNGVTPTAAMYVNVPQQQQYRTLEHQQEQIQHSQNPHHLQQYGGHNGSLAPG